MKRLDACAHWVAELLCAGHFSLLWEIILHYLAKYINLGNPKLPIYVLMRFNDFKGIIEETTIIQELDLRNNEALRHIFTELVCNLSVSNKNPAFQPIINLKHSSFVINELNELLRAPIDHLETIHHLFENDDPRELFLIFTEFSFFVSPNNHQDQSNACYWVDWLIQYQQHCAKEKMPLICCRRTHIPVEYKYQTDVIWIIWDILTYITESTPLLHKIVKSILHLFCIQYKTTACLKRINLLFFAISLITKPCDFSIEIIPTVYKESVENIITNLDKFYKELKPSAITPKNDFMFMNIKDQSKYNLQKGLLKMNMFANMENR